MSLDTPLVAATRDGVVESVHSADVVVAMVDGPVRVLAGDPDRAIYPRSALKPFQVLAVIEQLADLGLAMASDQLAIACASHDGGDSQQIAAASLLAEADLEEDALQCPPDWPQDDVVKGELHAPTTLSHNCSGKHAAMLWAHVAAGHPAKTYLQPGSVLQLRIARWLADVLGAPPGGPGTDGCGAPAWLTTPIGLATAFAALAAGRTSMLASVRDAMCDHPELVGGLRLPDTLMMLADTRVVAKRGAEGIMGAGFLHERHGPVGVAVKIHDGGDRAAGPLMAAVLEALGAIVPEEVRHAPVLGGGLPHGDVRAYGSISLATTEAFGLA